MLYKKVMELQSYLGRSKAALTPSGLTESQVQKRVSLSARNWNALSLAQKDELRVAARIEEAKTSQANAAACLATERDILELRLKRKLQGFSTLPPKMVFSSCVFTMADEEELSSLFQNRDLFSKASVEKRRKGAVTHGMLSEAHFARLSSMPIAVKPLPTQPWWLSLVANCRDMFPGCALVIGTGDDAQYWRFLYAKKAPHLASFSKLQLQEPEYTAVLGLRRMGGEREHLAWRYSFACDRMHNRDAWEIDTDPKSNIFVLAGLVDM